MIQSNLLLSDVDIPVHDNLITTSISTNTNSPSNNDILPTYETHEDIPVITPGDGSVFPSDPAQLPKITSLEELLRYLSEIMIRFNSNPEYYLQNDYALLIKTITNSLIYLYQNNEVDLHDLVDQVNNKVDKIVGKTLTTNDLTDILKELYDTAYTHSQSAHAPVDAEKNVQADWNAESGPSAILNKPTNLGGGTFENDIIVSLPAGKTLGKYESGQTIPSTGKTAEEVFNLIAVEAIPPTVTLTTTTGTIPFNTTTAHSKVLNFTKTVNSLGGTVNSVSLEWKRSNESVWSVLSTNPTITTYTHVYTDSALNTNSFNYRYIVNDDKGGTATATVNIAIAAYVAPSTNINETDTKELGNIETVINGTITVNSVNCPILTRTLKVSTNNVDWVDINNPSNNTVNYTHNDITYLNATTLYYRLTLTDAKQTTNLAIGTITFVYKSALGYLTVLSGTDQDKLNAILAFGNTSLTNSKSRTINNITAAGGTYTYYIYAASAGNLTSIIQDGAAPVIGAFTKLTDVTGTNSYGANVTYRIYKSNATNAFTNNTLTFN